MVHHANHTCPMPAEAFDYGAKGSAHHAMLLIGLACTGVTVISSLALIILHLRRYRCPKEQRQIVRIIFIVVVYSVVEWLSIFSYKAAQYLEPVPALYEAFCLCALFLLYIQYAAPGGTFGHDMFQAVREADEKGTAFDWPRISWIMVFQFPIVELLAVIVTEATNAANKYCKQSLSPQFGNLWASIINTIGVSLSVMSIWRFYGRTKSVMKVRRGLAKLGAFKVIVFVSFVQDWIFNILLEHNVMKPSKTFSYDDLAWGIPALVLCCEMVIFSAFFWYAYSSTEYSSNAKPRHPKLPLWKAILDALNPYDLFAGIARMFGIFLHLKTTGGFQEWSNARKGAKGVPAGYENLTHGMDSLPRPNQPHHYRGESQQSAADVHTSAPYGATAYDPAQMYMPPSGSPPGYTDPQEKQYLMTENVTGGRSRASSVGNDGADGPIQWNGQRYERSPSPSGRPADRTRDFV